MKRTVHVKLLLAVIVALVVVAALAPAAFAGQITRIMYAQESVDYYAYTATTAGNLSVSVSWTNASGTGAPVWPNASVNAGIQTGPSTDPYADLDVAELYDTATNPVVSPVGGTPLAAGQTAYVMVQPYVGDVPYSLSCSFTGTGVYKGKVAADGTTTGNTSTKTFAETGWAYAADGETYIRTAGQWYGVGQYWPGLESNNTALTNWNLYSVERSDYVSGTWPEWTYPLTWESNTAQVYTGNSQDGSSTIANGNLGPSQINRWYSQTPQMWGGMAVSNVWPSAPADPFFRYGKPGSLASTVAPLWYTYSYADSSATKPGYSWSNVVNASASKRAYGNESATSATISWRYQGPNFSWIYTTGPKGAIQKVTIDGGTPILVDQYSAAAVYKAKTDFVVGGAVDAWHDVVITGNGTRNAGNTTAYFLYHDAFIDPDETTPYAENNYDGMTSYSWGKTSNTAASPVGVNGAYMSTKASASSTAFTANFANNTASVRTFKWTYVKGPKAGIVNVYIDGALQGTVDLYSAAPTYGNVYTSVQLAKGWHTMFITGTGTRNVGNTTGYFIYSDCWQAEAQAVVEAE